MPTAKETGEILESTIAQGADELAEMLKAVKISELPPKLQIYISGEIIGIIRDANLQWEKFKATVPELNKK